MAGTVAGTAVGAGMAVAGAADLVGVSAGALDLDGAGADGGGLAGDSGDRRTDIRGGDTPRMRTLIRSIPITT